MAVVGCTGFEAGQATADNITLTGTASYDTGTVRTGSRSIRCNPASGAQGVITPGNPLDVLGFFNFGLRIASLPSLARVICGQLNNGSNIKLNSDGTLEAFDGSTSRGSSAVLSLNTWYWIGWRTSAGTTVDLLQVNGVTAVTGTTTTAGTRFVGFSGTEASAADAYIDDIITDDATFIAPSKVNLALPISDNARDTLWTGGVGGTTNLFDAVNNTPPIGTATETDLTQIEHAGGAAGTTDRYDANMTTYTNLGINTGDTILAIEYLIAHGEDVATGTKLLNFSLVSNPTQASGIANFAAGANVGALGTYPTNWTVTFNTIITSPSVTLSTSPVMRVVRPETATRVASVCFMGMNVAWTPAAPAPAGYAWPALTVRNNRRILL